MKTTYHANKSLVLVDNEVYVLSDELIKEGDWYYSSGISFKYSIHLCDSKRLADICNSMDAKKITATTNKNIPNVHHLERKLFVKPDVDVEELAFNYCDDYQSRLINAHYFQRDNAITHFKAGFNANKKEFERGHLFDLFCRMQMGKIKTIEDWEQYMNEIQLLSLPSSIEANEYFTEIKVNW